MGMKGEPFSDVDPTSMPLWSLLVPAMILQLAGGWLLLSPRPYSYTLYDFPRPKDGFSALCHRDILRLSFLTWIGGSLRKCGLGRRAEDGDEYGHGQYCARLSILMKTSDKFQLPP